MLLEKLRPQVPRWSGGDELAAVVPGAGFYARGKGLGDAFPVSWASPYAGRADWEQSLILCWHDRRDQRAGQVNEGGRPVETSSFRPWSGVQDDRLHTLAYSYGRDSIEDAGSSRVCIANPSLNPPRRTSEAATEMSRRPRPLKLLRLPTLERPSRRTSRVTYWRRKCRSLYMP